MTQSGIKEASEPFTKKQTGSSAMPHKKNPVICERICGLARLVRSHVDVAISNIALWNERDISHSSNERIILEEASAITYYILERLIVVVKDLTVSPANIKKGLKEAGLYIFSSGVLKLLLDSGLSREDAYSLTKETFMKSVTRADIKRVLKKNTNLSINAVDKVLDFKYYLRNIDKIYNRLEL
jgi:adenylosuccinate lyase